MRCLKSSFVLSVVFFFMGITPVFCSSFLWDGNNHYYEFNNHYYEFVPTSTRTNWTADLEKASRSDYRGIKGHLATITSAEENAFILNTFSHSTEFLVFIGGRDLGGINPHPVEDVGKWVWYDGPEKNIQFYQEDGSGGSVTDPYNYANWAPGQPNRSDVHYLAMSLKTGTWYDTNNGGYTGGPGSVKGYIVEYSTPVPLPSALVLFGLGLTGLFLFRSRTIFGILPRD